MTVLVKAIQRHRYNGAQKEVGDNYQADDVDLPALEVQHFALRVDDLIGEPGTPTPAPDPILIALVPNTAVIGVPSFTLHVQGSGFTPGSVIVFNGYDEPTTFVSATEITTGVNMDVWTAPSEPLPVLVRNPDGKQSTALPFTFTAAQ